ncbi:MAG: DUF58 domain-containing protein [Clostridia bacterium]|nr:DUF58 domain-containing protein [Clostridia bacterium]
MTGRGRTILVMSLSALVYGMSLGNRIFYLAALFGLLALIYGLISVLLSKRSLTVSCRMENSRIPRGDEESMLITVGKRGFLPVYPVEISVKVGDAVYHYDEQPSRREEITFAVALPTQHVGVFSAEITQYAFYDIFGLFRIRRKNADSCQMMVLPRAFDVEKLRFYSNDDGQALQNRTSEDLASPEDTRAYRTGDALKRIHWKLSARKKELIVRRFEMPAPPDTLVLLDLSRPNAHDTEEALTLRDTLCETALSVISMQLKGHSPVRMPLYGTRAQEFYSKQTEDLPRLQEMLACQTFEEELSFDRVLRLELRRMRQTGATVIVTTHLDVNIVEGISHIRRMGPNARVYLITRTPDSEEDRPLVMQLQQCLVEVCYVTPA